MTKYIKPNISIQSADAEDVKIQFAQGELILMYIDWKETQQRVKFEDTLAFRWQEFDDVGIRDDMVYEVQQSDWLASQAALLHESPDEYVHYKICFNTCGVLDIICKRTGVNGA